MTRRHRPDLKSDAGAIAPATAAVLAVLIGFVGLVGDVSMWFAERRVLQAATDAAALAGASELANVPGRARASSEAILAANGIPASAIKRFETGWYCPEGATPTSRFQATRCASLSSANPNAVRITTSADTPMVLSRMVQDSQTGQQLISLQATAAQINQAGLEAGAGVASLNAGIANAALSALTGGTISLTLADYQGLASTRVDTLSLLDALAAEVGVTAGAYGQLLNTEVGVRDVLQATVEVLDKQRALAGVSASIAGLRSLEAQVPVARTVKLGDLFDLGVWDATPVGHRGASRTALNAGVNVYQLATFSLQAANGANAVTIPGAALGINGLASVNLDATLIEPPQGAYFAFGPEGVRVHTAVVRTKLSLNVPLVATALPLYIEAGGGDAEITDISCAGDPASQAKVKVHAESGLANVYVGAPRLDVMRNFDRKVTYADIEPATAINLNLLGLGLVQVTTGLRGHVAVGTGSGDLTFVQPAAYSGGAGRGVIGAPLGAYGQAPVMARVGTTSLAGGLGNLAESLEINLRTCVLVCVNLPLKGAALGQLFNVLDPVFTSLDAPLTGLLQALGVQAGYVDVAITGVRCGLPVLVA